MNRFYALIILTLIFGLSICAKAADPRTTGWSSAWGQPRMSLGEAVTLAQNKAGLGFYCTKAWLASSSETIYHPGKHQLVMAHAVWTIDFESVVGGKTKEIWVHENGRMTVYDPIPTMF